jgi:hypothetical protein
MMFFHTARCSMSSTNRFVAVPLLLVALGAPAAHAQSAKDILDRMVAEYERRADGVTDYTLVQETMGVTMVTYMVKETVNGHPVFRPKSTTVEGSMHAAIPMDENRADASSDIVAMADRLAEHAEYAGQESIDGQRTHVIVLNDISGLDLGPRPQSKDTDFSMKRGKMFVDAKLWIPRRMEFEGTAKTEHGTSDVTMVMNFADIRDVDGILQPYHTTATVTGLMGAMDPEMQKRMADPETQKQLAEMKKQLESMPADQRAMVEKMMKGKLEQLEKMTAAGGDTVTVETEVKDVRVNAGPPKGQ